VKRPTRLTDRSCARRGKCCVDEHFGRGPGVSTDRGFGIEKLLVWVGSEELLIWFGS
jgi:hypothetical protein